jgi:hypothetical protein
MQESIIKIRSRPDPSLLTETVAFKGGIKKNRGEERILPMRVEWNLNSIPTASIIEIQNS